MRTGPFSNSRVIERLNASFVPVYAVNEVYRKPGGVPDDEKAEYRRIYRETLAKKMSAGTVHVYVLDPEGTPIASMHVAQAKKTDKLIEQLDRVVADLGVKPGKPLVAPKPQSVPPPHKEGSLVLHLVARPLGGGGSWGGTAENWVVYTPEEIKRLLPANLSRPGRTWTPDAELAARLLRHVYPVTENNDVTKNEIMEQSLTAEVVSIEDGVCRARLDGRLRMKHDFYHKPDGKEVSAGLLGYIDFDAEEGKIRRFRLVTDEARYGGGTFGVAVRSEP